MLPQQRCLVTRRLHAVDDDVDRLEIPYSGGNGHLHLHPQHFYADSFRPRAVCHGGCPMHSAMEFLKQ